MEILNLIQLPGKLAKHIELTEALRELIRNQTIPSGVRLPQEDLLAEHLRVSRTVTRKAYSTLMEENLIRRIPKKGLVVQKKVVYAEFKKKFRNISEEMIAAGIKPSIRLIDKAIVHNKDINLHQFAQEEQLLKLSRIFYADDIAFLYIESYYPMSRFKEIEEVDFSQRPAFALMQERFGFKVSKSRRSLHPELLSSHVAKMLEVPNLTACMKLDTEVFDEKGQCVEVAMTFAIADRVSLEL